MADFGQKKVDSFDVQSRPAPPPRLLEMPLANIPTGRVKNVSLDPDFAQLELSATVAQVDRSTPKKRTG
jgi:hypothetical protein